MDALVVEDDLPVQQGLKRLLQRAGFNVSTASHGLEALQQLHRHACSVILCDLHMPTLQGKSFYEQLEEEFPHLAGRVVFVTAWSRDPDLRQFLEETGQPFLPKPVDAPKLLEVVRDVCERAASRVC